MRQKKDISDRKSKGSSLLPTLFAPRLLGRPATSNDSSYTKNEYNLFYHKLDAE